MNLQIADICEFLDQLHEATAHPQNVTLFLAHLDTLDYDSIEVIFDNVQLPARSLLPLHFKGDLKEQGIPIEDYTKASFAEEDVQTLQERVFSRLYRYIPHMPLVVDKLLSILAFLAVHTLRRKTNPIRQLSASLFYNRFIQEDDDMLEIFYANGLDTRGCLLLLSFATRLIEQIPNAKLSQQNRMESVRPLQDASEDLAKILEGILMSHPWDVTLVQKMLYCYRSWVEYAVRGEEVKFEILSLAAIVSSNIRAIFSDLETIWTAAEVFSDIAEGSKLPKSISQVLQDLISNDLVQQSYQFYLSGSVGLDTFTSIASLAIALAEDGIEELIDPLTPQKSKVLETMLYLLSGDISSRTFNFWESFAEASVDIGDGYQAEGWLQQVLSITLEKTCWRDDIDYDELTAYRTDVAELFEGLSEVLRSEAVNDTVINYLDIATSKHEIQEKVVILETTLFFLTCVKSNFTLNESLQGNLFHSIFEVLDIESIDPELLILIHRTVLNFFIPYAKSLEKLGLSFRALALCFQYIHVPEIATAAANAISKIIQSSALIALHIPEVAQEVRRLIVSQVNIFEKTRVVEGYTFLAVLNSDKEDVPSNIRILIEAFEDVNIETCDSTQALDILKIGLAIGKTLYTTAPAKLDAIAWKQGEGKKMGEWFRRVVATFSQRFGDDFEIMETITEILQFSLSNRGGLLDFSAGEVTDLIAMHFSKHDVMESNSSTLILGLATSLTRLHSGKNSADIAPQIEAIMSQLTNSLIPPLDLPRMDVFSPEILQLPLIAPFREISISNPELLYQYFEFLSKTMTRYTGTWKEEHVQRWIVCILISLGNPEGGMSFQGSVEFLTTFLEKVNGNQPPAILLSVFAYFGEAILAQIIWTVSLPAASSALPNLSRVLRLLLRIKSAYPRMWLDLLEKYIVRGTEEGKRKFCWRVMRYLGDKEMLEIVKEWWSTF